MRPSDPVSVSWKQNTLNCSGFITFMNANEFVYQFAAIDFPKNRVIQIDLHDLSIGDGLALLVLSKSIANVGRHFNQVLIAHPPNGLESYLKNNQHLKNIEFTDNRIALNEELAEML